MKLGINVIKNLLNNFRGGATEISLCIATVAKQNIFLSNGHE